MSDTQPVTKRGDGAIKGPTLRGAVRRLRDRVEPGDRLPTVDYVTGFADGAGVRLTPDGRALRMTEAGYRKLETGILAAQRRRLQSN